MAVTERAWSIVTVQVSAVPEQAPPQPRKTLSACGVAVSVTRVPLVKDAVHVAPQLTPAGLEATEPGPVVATFSAKVAGSKLAVTLLVWLMGKVQVVAVPAAAQAPPHPVNVWPAVAEAVRVIGVLIGTDMVALEQAAPQLIGYPSALLDSATLEVQVDKAVGITGLFTQLAAQHIEVVSLRNKTNRLEELFVSLVEKNLAKVAI